jgi:hypothetical protein
MRELPPASGGERYFVRLPTRTRPGDVVQLDDGAAAVVDTVHVAEDRRDAKCIVITQHAPAR